MRELAPQRPREANRGPASPHANRDALRDTGPAAARLDRVPVEAGANVGCSSYTTRLERTRHRAVTIDETTVDIITVSAAQAVVDLLSSPGRGPQEAEALMEKMKEPRSARYTVR